MIYLPSYLRWSGEGARVKGHATEDMVRFGQVGVDGRFGNKVAGGAADLGRRRVDPVVIDAGRNLSGVCAASVLHCHCPYCGQS